MEGDPERGVDQGPEARPDPAAGEAAVGVQDQGADASVRSVGLPYRINPERPAAPCPARSAAHS
jgi:hypothetical protein